jgi:hypothetical protein
LKKFMLSALALVALVVASAAYTAASPSAKLKKQDRVYGGGQVGAGCFSNSDFCYGFPHNFAVDGHAQSDGSEAVGNSNIGVIETGTESSNSITCLRVEGNKAAIGGVIESGANAGFWYAQYFIDRGGPGLGDRDLASPEFVDPAGSPNWPAGFPYTCPSPTTGFPAGVPIYREISTGDVVVQDAPSA